MNWKQIVNLFIVDFDIRKNLYPCFLYNTCCNRPHSQICYRYHGNHHRGKPCKYWGWCYNTSEGNFPYMAPHWDSTDRLLQEKISRQPLHALNSKSLHVHTCYFSIHVHVVSLLSLCTKIQIIFTSLLFITKFIKYLTPNLITCNFFFLLKSYWPWSVSLNKVKGLNLSIRFWF